MKKLILVSLCALMLASCQKEQTNSRKPLTVSKDTIPDKSAIHISMVKDSVFYIESALVFNHAYSNVYVFGEDGTFMSAGGPIALYFLSSEARPLGLDGLPYRAGMTVKTYVGATASGPYFIRIQKLFSVPESIQIWLRDKLMKDSLELHTGNYHFNIDKADTSTFGNNRFEIVLRPK